MYIINESIKEVWVFVIAAAGAILGLIARAHKELNGFPMSKKVAVFIFRTISSMFLAYISFEAAAYLFHSDDMAIAVAGCASYFGTTLLAILQNKAPELFEKWLDKLIK